MMNCGSSAPKNQGLPLEQARARADAAGVVVNGLPVISTGNGRWVRPVEMNLDGYFEENVITGPGAFVLPARTEAEFREAILRKLVIEIAGALPSPEELGRDPARPATASETGLAP